MEGQYQIKRAGSESDEIGWVSQEGQFQVRMVRSGGEGQCQERKVRSGWKGNVKGEWLGQVGRAMSSENG